MREPTVQPTVQPKAVGSCWRFRSRLARDPDDGARCEILDASRSSDGTLVYVVRLDTGKLRCPFDGQLEPLSR